MALFESPRDGGTAIILGAGASFGSSLKFRPPIMSSFIREGKKVVKYEYKKLWDFLKRIGFNANELDLGNPNLEELYSRLFIISIALWNKDLKDFIQDLGGDLKRVTPVQFLESFIIEVTSVSSLEALENSCSFHDELIKKLHKGDSIISFNYDLIADSSIKKICQWTEITGYGFFCSDLLKMNEEAFPDWEANNDILLLKLHGSLNWVLQKKIDFDLGEKSSRTPRFNPPSFHESLFGVKNEKLPTLMVKPLDEIKNKKSYIPIPAGEETFYETLLKRIPEDEHWKIPSIANIKGETFIIPPTMYKFGDYLLPEELHDVWYNAKLSLSRAKEIIAIGYSFPPTDLHFDTLFRLAVKNNTNTELVLKLVLPNKNVVEKIKKSFPFIRVEHIANTFEEYVNEVLN